MLNTRAWNIALRTAHIAAMGVLLVGHAFDIPPSDLGLWVSLGLTVATGVALGMLEAGPRLLCFHQCRGFERLLPLDPLRCGGHQGFGLLRAGRLVRRYPLSAVTQETCSRTLAI